MIEQLLPTSMAEIAPTNILLIEDEDSDAILFQEFLSERNDFSYKFHRAVSLLDALNQLRFYKFDVILLDLSLPDGYGPELLFPLREAAPQIPVIILTGLDSQSVAVKAVKEGVQDYLVKGSFDSSALVRSMRYAIERQKMLMQLEKARELEQYLAYHDVLTGMPNRKLFFDRLHQSIIHARRMDRVVGVFFVDLDNFKRINDTLGHSIGDNLLKSTAERLQKSIRESDTVARIGGDEFTLIVDNLSSEKDAVIACEKIIRELGKPVLIDQHELYITASIGISLFPFDGSDIEALIKNADVAMYRAKSGGKNTYELYNLSMDAQAVEKMGLENDLRRAVENDEFVLHYQPVFNVKENRITSLEALVRWNHPQKGMIAPNLFIPVAEESGLINPIGELILNKACREIKSLQDNGYMPIKVAINLSTKQFRDHQLTEKVITALESTGLAPEYLGVEITESSVMLDVDYTISTLRNLKKHGIQVSVDDFGTGYSSLSYLKQLPADILKIDRAFIDGVPSDKNDMSITAAIIGLAHNLDLSVVAEGVETVAQAQYLQTLNCDHMQGYHFSKPLDYDSLCRFLP